MRRGKECRLVRRAGESVMIGHSVEVIVESIDGDRVRLVCRAPSMLPVGEREVVEKVASENRRAAQSRLPRLEDLFHVRTGE